VDPVFINNRNLNIIGSLGMPREDYLRTVEMAAAHGKRLGFDDLVTHRFPLERTEEAIGVAAKGFAVKTVVVPG
jgi:5-exo-hydroxycamphor dehydrogenase